MTEDVSLAEGNQNDHEGVEDADQRRCKSALARAEPPAGSEARRVQPHLPLGKGVTTMSVCPPASAALRVAPDEAERPNHSNQKRESSASNLVIPATKRR